MPTLQLIITIVLSLANGALAFFANRWALTVNRGRTYLPGSTFVAVLSIFAPAALYFHFLAWLASPALTVAIAMAATGFFGALAALVVRK